MDSIIQQLKNMEEELNKPFPSHDLEKIREDFQTSYVRLSEEENWLKCDLA